MIRVGFVDLKNRLRGRERGTRTPGGVTLNGFQDRRFQPLSHLPHLKSHSNSRLIHARFVARKSEFLEATPRFELGNQGFAGPRLTTWLCRHKIVVLEAGLEPARMQYPRDFKSLVSTNSTTRALISHLKK